jgi:endoglucanase
VNYRDAGPLPLTTQLMPEIEVVNTGTTPIDLAGITVRYWFTEDGNFGLKYTCTYAASGCSAITGTFVKAGGKDSDHYLQLQLSGTLAPGASTGMIQQRITKANLSIFDQTNDYSYGSSMTSQAWTHITAYYNGKLIWGQEP